MRQGSATGEAPMRRLMQRSAPAPWPGKQVCCAGLLPSERCSGLQLSSQPQPGVNGSPEWFTSQLRALLPSSSSRPAGAQSSGPWPGAQLQTGRPARAPELGRCARPGEVPGRCRPGQLQRATGSVDPGGLCPLDSNPRRLDSRLPARPSCPACAAPAAEALALGELMASAELGSGSRSGACGAAVPRRMASSRAGRWLGRGWGNEQFHSNVTRRVVSCDTGRPLCSTAPLKSGRTNNG